MAANHTRSNTYALDGFRRITIPLKNIQVVTDLPPIPHPKHFPHRIYGFLHNRTMQQMMSPPRANSSSTMINGIDNAVAKAPGFVKEQVHNIEKKPVSTIVGVIVVIVVIAFIVWIVRYCARRRRAQRTMRQQNLMDLADSIEMERYGIRNQANISRNTWYKPKKSVKWWSSN